MATSAFKSTTKRAEIGGGSSSKGSSSSRSLRPSRSLSRFSHQIAQEPEPDYIKNVSRGKFVNTERGFSTAALTDISLDDLAMEFFSSSSSLNENECDGGKERESRSVSRRGGEVERWASDTASSRRRVRSVSRSRDDAGSSSVSGKVISSSAVGSRGRSVSRSRGDALSSSEAKKVILSSAAGSRRRRSLSVARYHQISDSE